MQMNTSSKQGRADKRSAIRHLYAQRHPPIRVPQKWRNFAFPPYPNAGTLSGTRMSLADRRNFTTQCPLPAFFSPDRTIRLPPVTGTNIMVDTLCLRHRFKIPNWRKPCFTAPAP
jgi:hypothetical protein